MVAADAGIRRNRSGKQECLERILRGVIGDNIIFIGSVNHRIKSADVVIRQRAIAPEAGKRNDFIGGGKYRHPVHHGGGRSGKHQINAAVAVYNVVVQPGALDHRKQHIVAVARFHCQ
ncbi:hypothetical protein SDC9_174545 [bioreactor metagenome]|uniref:Uncharacterized protein n=1 Tax=bioreactor metagenome TaxID=1076179 RepID=A0A645GJL6_9ZZZZ